MSFVLRDEFAAFTFHDGPSHRFFVHTPLWRIFDVYKSPQRYYANINVSRLTWEFNLSTTVYPKLHRCYTMMP